MFRPGQQVAEQQLGANPVLVEFAGTVPPADMARRRPREGVWVVWQWDGARWIELGRTQSSDWTWQLALREVITEALRRQRPLIDISAEAEKIAEGVLASLDSKLEFEPAPVCLIALRMLETHLTGRMVRAEEDWMQCA